METLPSKGKCGMSGHQCGLFLLILPYQVRAYSLNGGLSIITIGPVFVLIIIASRII